MNKFAGIKNEIMDLFHGLMYGNINYKYDNLHCAMKTNICEVFSSIAEEVVINIELGNEVTDEQLIKLCDNLISFSNDFQVKEAKLLAMRIKKTL